MELRPFVILTLPRSGSYHLRALLDSAGDITCYGEIFKGSRVELPELQLSMLGLKSTETEARDKMGMAILNRLRKETDRKEKIFGFKDFRFNLNRVGILDQIIASKGWRKVFLFRNPLERYLSLERADQTGVFVVTTETRTEGLDLTRKVRFDPEKFDQSHAAHKRLLNDLRKSREKSGEENTFRMDYSEVNDPARLGQLLAFLGSTAQAEGLRSNHVKQFAEPLSQGVENWSDLVAHLADQGLSDLVSAAS